MTSEPIKTMKAKNADHISMSHNEMVIHSKIENKKDISKQESPNEQSSLKSTQTTAHNVITSYSIHYTKLYENIRNKRII